jgi:hypothetical protein
MASVRPSIELQSPIAWMKTNPISFPSIRDRSESLPPPRTVTKGQIDPISQHLYVEDIIPLNDETKKSELSTSNGRASLDRNIKKASQSFTLMKTIDEKEQRDQQSENNRLSTATVTRIKTFSLPDVVQVEANSAHPLSPRIRSESLSPSKVLVGQMDLPSENRYSGSISPLNTMTNELQQTTTNFHPENVRASNYRFGSFSSLKGVDEKDQKDYSTKPNRDSIFSPDGKQQSVTVFNSRTNVLVTKVRTGDLKPLSPTLNQNRQLSPNLHTDSVHTVKYNFQSSDSTTPISGKQEETNRRSV